MPVGTKGDVKCLTNEEVHEVSDDLILGNTYHLWLSPGTNTLDKAGGLRGFNKWDGTERDKTCRFFEYNEKYDLTNRDSFVKILTDVEKNDYLNDFFKFMNLRRNDYE